jgi:hypothetical protein
VFHHPAQTADGNEGRVRNGRPVVLLGDARCPPPRKSKLVVLFEMRPNRGVIDNDRYAAVAAT